MEHVYDRVSSDPNQVRPSPSHGGGGGSTHCTGAAHNMKNGQPAIRRGHRAREHLVVVCQLSLYAERDPDAVVRAAQRALVDGLTHELRVSGEVFTRPPRSSSEPRPDGAGPGGPGDPRNRELEQTRKLFSLHRLAARESGRRPRRASRARHAGRVAATAPFTSHRQNAQVGGEVQRFFVEGVARYLAHKVNRADASVAEETLGRTALLRRGRVEWLEAAALRIRGARGGRGRLAQHQAMQEAFGGYLFERDGPTEFMPSWSGPGMIRTTVPRSVPASRSNYSRPSG